MVEKEKEVEEEEEEEVEKEEKHTINSNYYQLSLYDFCSRK